MAQCIYCNKKGFFLRVSEAGLCENCHEPVILSIQSILRVYNESLDLVEKSKNFNTRYKRVEIAIEKAQQLYDEYWQKGVRFFEPNPKQAVEKLKEKRLEIIESEIKNRVERHLEKAERAKTIRTKISNADKALDELVKFRQEFDYENKDLEANIHAFIHKAQYDDFILNAEKNEFKGNTKKALDLYLEALFFLQKDDIPDEEQKDLIKEIETKIKKLKNRLES